MRRILVPTDFSNNAMKAVAYSAEFARRTGAVIYLLHVIEPIIDQIRQPYPLHERLLEEIASARRSELKILKDTLANTYPDVIIETALANGAVISAISDFSEKIQADIIVMGTEGASGFKEAFLGSVTGGIIGRTKIPVLAVPAEYKAETPDAIVFATNRFEENRQLLHPIVELASLYHAAVHIVVFMNADAGHQDDYIYKDIHLKNYLGFLEQTYPGIAFTGALLKGKAFEETIAHYDTKNEVDILAMIIYPESFWEKLLKKSVIKKMAFHSKIPLLAIPAA